LTEEQIINAIIDLPDEVLSRIQFSMPWQYDPDGVSDAYGVKDADGFPVTGSAAVDRSVDNFTRLQLQDECWRKFSRNPQLNTAVRGLVGRLTGLGHQITSPVRQVQDFVDDIREDWRNRLYHFWPKYCGRSYVDGELYLVGTCHRDGFIEIDFLDPKAITGSSSQDASDGILFHPRKTHLPILYNIKIRLHEYQEREFQLPSIYVARDPNLIKAVKTDQLYDLEKLREAMDPHPAFKQLGGFNKFVIAWDRSFITRRAVSYLRTTLEWLNHYENLKKFEIDHKKSSGAYLWIFTFEDVKAFKNWLLLSDEDKRKTGIGAKKVPGSSLVLPPGMTCEAKHPQLPRISDEDTDIMQMISSGLNEPEDVTLGKSNRPFGSVKASRGPMSDRISDEVSLWQNFERYDFWGSLFFLRSKIDKRFPARFAVEEAVDFKTNGNKEPEPIFQKVLKKPERLIEISYPTSEILGIEATAKGLLGVKHGNLSDILGIPRKRLAEKMGFGNYRRMRLEHATEEKQLPKLVDPLDDEMLQEKRLEPSPKKKPAAAKPAPKKKAQRILPDDML